MSGVERGADFRFQRDRRRQVMAEHGEDREYERARRLRETVGHELLMQGRQGDIRQQERALQVAESRRLQIQKAAATIRQRFGADPRLKGLTLLPDEDLVREWGDLLSNPQRMETRRDRDRDQTRQDLASVERQVDDTRSDLGRAEREAPTRPPLAAYDPKVAQQYTADSTAHAVGVGLLRQRADSLGQVRDSIAAEVQGRRYVRPGAPAGTGQPKRRISQDQADYLKHIGQWDPNRYEVILEYGPPTP